MVKILSNFTVQKRLNKFILPRIIPHICIVHIDNHVRISPLLSRYAIINLNLIIFLKFEIFS